MAKNCFVISVIGAEGSKERQHADLLKNHIIAPAIQPLGYNAPIRADQMAEPGMITNQIVSAIMESDLVVADLSHENGNVFYELAIGHAAQKPVIHMALDGAKLPFDNAQARTIFFGLQVDKAKEATDALSAAVKAAEESKRPADNPIGQALKIEAVAASADTHAETLASLLEMQTTTQHMISRVLNQVGGVETGPAFSPDFASAFDRIETPTFDTGEGQLGGPIGDVLRAWGHGNRASGEDDIADT